jgi:hypothetical protein
MPQACEDDAPPQSPYGPIEDHGAPEDTRMAARNRTDAGPLGLLWRVLAPLAIVLVTYNPSGYSFYTWFSDALAADGLGGGGLGGLHFLALVVLLICWSILVVATWQSLDLYGVFLIAALLGAIVWVLIDFGLLRADSSDTIAWIVLICGALVLAVGLSWSHVWRRLTGQLAVDEIDE